MFDENEYLEVFSRVKASENLTRRVLNMKYILIGIAISAGWHLVKLIYKFLEEVIFTRLHAAEWYAVLCKKQTGKVIPLAKETLKKDKSYKETAFGFKVS